MGYIQEEKQAFMELLEEHKKRFLKYTSAVIDTTNEKLTKHYANRLYASYSNRQSAKGTAFPQNKKQKPQEKS